MRNKTRDQRHVGETSLQIPVDITDFGCRTAHLMSWLEICCLVKDASLYRMQDNVIK